MENQQIKGILIKVFNTKQVTERFKIREFILRINHTTQYPQEIKMQFVQDKCDVIDPYPMGIEVVVDFNLKGRAYQDRQLETQWVNTIEAWKIQPTTPFKKEQTYDYERKP